ncbi:MAG: alpha/beta fold hydrolase [Myxococcota bacterium]
MDGRGLLSSAVAAAMVMGLGCGFPDVPPPIDNGTTGGDDTTSSPSAPTALDDTGPVADGNGSSGDAGTTGLPADGSGESTGEDLLGAPYPILFAHGFFGFDELEPVGGVEYWYDVESHLIALGETELCFGQIDPFNDSIDRADALHQELLDCIEQTGRAKVNIIAHSQGGLDARVVAHLAPDRVASITTVATPHYGTPIADIAVGILPNENAGAIVDWLVQLVGQPLWDELGNETSFYDSMVQMSHEGMVEFNAAYPDVEGVLYTSLTGRTGLHAGGEACEPDSPPPPLFITDYEGDLDTTDPLFLIPEAILSDGVLSQEPNDGLVRAIDARWGEFLGCVPADHVDEVGHLFGDSPGIGNDWNHLEMYAGLVQYLRLRDL